MIIRANFDSVEFCNWLHPAVLGHVLGHEGSYTLSRSCRRPLAEFKVGALQVPFSVQVQVWLVSLSRWSVGLQVVCRELGRLFSHVEVALS